MSVLVGLFWTDGTAIGLPQINGPPFLQWLPALYAPVFSWQRKGPAPLVLEAEKSAGPYFLDKVGIVCSKLRGWARIMSLDTVAAFMPSALFYARADNRTILTESRLTHVNDTATAFQHSVSLETDKGARNETTSANRSYPAGGRNSGTCRDKLIGGR